MPAPHTTTAQITAQPLVTDPADPAARRRPDERADGGRREQEPDDRRAAMELLDREHREQRPGHPEHHRDDVDHERRLQDLAAAQEREPLLHRAPPDRRSFALGGGIGRIEIEASEQQADRDQVDRVRPREPEARDDDPGERRARSGRRRSR